MGRLNEIQKDIKISYGNNSIELHIEDDGIHISTGNKQIIIDSDVLRESDKPFESNSLIIKQDLDNVEVKVDEHIVESEEKISQIQEESKETSEKLTEHVIDNKTKFADVDSNINAMENSIENLESTARSIQGDINTITDDVSLVKTEINDVKTDVSGTNTRVDNHIADNDDDFDKVNKKLNKIETNTKTLDSAKKAYDILAERYRILINEKTKGRTAPSRTKHTRVVKKTGWELTKQMARQELLDERVACGITTYPSEYEVLVRAYMIEGYEILDARRMARCDMGWGCSSSSTNWDDWKDC